MDDIDESDGDEDINMKLTYWNNWVPKKHAITESDSYNSSGRRIVQGEFNYSTIRSWRKINNWLPPKSFRKINVRQRLRLMKEDLVDDVPKSEINSDWGKRIDISNALSISDGDKFWNIIKRGCFDDIRLWKNEYGNVCCRASGKIRGRNSSDKCLFEINTEENMRKFLGLSSSQWSALCDVVKEKNCSLNFNAFNDFDLNTHQSIEKLWFFLCKRRHFLPDLTVQGKLSGAVKIMKELRIVPKIIVIDIRDIRGADIG